MAESLSAPYGAYRDALTAIVALAERVKGAERASAAARREAETRMGADAERVTARLAALAERRAALAERLAALPVTTHTRGGQRALATADPVDLLEQLLERAEGALGDCDNELAAIERQRDRLQHARAEADASSRREQETAAAVAAAARARAARGDQVLFTAQAVGIVLTLVAGIAGPTGSGAAAALVLGALVALVVRARPTTLAARLSARHAALTGESAGAPAAGPVLAPVAAGACALDGLAGAAGSLIGSHALGAGLAALVVGGAATYLLINIPRDTQGRTA
ncbi:MAG: hypothetical protein QOD69_1799 [Solirubrobacteraceae bacterium]|jgi:hypothetical protein|nr:hypothetical protein [Solirubrobacteraceae bacterium]